MKKVIFIQNTLFRIFIPPICGLILYVLILLIFDSLSSLSDNFFSQEAILLIILSYLLFFGLRQIAKNLDKKYPLKLNIRFRVLLQLLFGVIYSLLLINLIISVYYKYFVGFTSFSSELITFNAIFLITSIFYNILHLSLLLLNIKNEEQLNKEHILKENLELELNSFKREINPELFYGSLEALISLIKVEIKEADKFIQKFASVYRYILDNRKKELVNLREELKYIIDFIYLLNVRFNNNIYAKFNITAKYQIDSIIPCTLQRIIENIIFSNIITHLHPLEIEINIEDNRFITMTSSMNKRLNINDSISEDFKRIKKAYSYFTEQEVKSYETDGKQVVKLPLIKLEAIEELE